jgi:hypothetical protein
VQCAGDTQNDPSAPSVHSPRPRPVEYAQVPSMQSEGSTQALRSMPDVHAP